MNPWLDHARQFSYVRAHISAFAVGSVLLLALNLLVRSPEVWADTWITAWGMIVVIHLVVASMARLAIQLMAEEDIRPASEVTWRPVDPAATWQAPKPEPPAPPETSPETPADAWQAASAPQEPAGAKEEERVSWQAAADAAWLNRPDATASQEPADTNVTDDQKGKPDASA